MTEILVSGGAGFIGVNLCKKLLSQGHEVIAIDNLITASGQNIKKLSENPKFKFIKHDITKPLPPVFSHDQTTVKYIYHLACPTGVPNIKTLGEEMLLTSSLGTRNMLEMARKYSATLLFTSSSEVYGQPEVFPQSEDYNGNVNPVGYRSPYEEGKRFSESLVMLYIRKYNLSAKIVRVFNTYGPYMSPTDTRVIPTFIRQAIDNKPIPIHGDGTQTRTFCYVDDLIKGLIIIMNRGKSGEIYNLGSDKEIPILTVARMIQKIAGSKSVIKFTKRPEHDHERRNPDLHKIRDLSWIARFSLHKGLARTIQWYMS
jgi:dTDP-glucose 4,6-dehydratase/UDP-glucuronate decarboxylase